MEVEGLRMKTLKNWNTGLLTLCVIAASVLVAACGGSGGTTTTSSGSTSESTETTTAEESTQVAEAGSGEVWSLPNVNVQNTRAIESDITPENVTTLKPAWTVELKGAGTFGNFAANPVFSPDGKSVYLQDLANDVFAVNVESGEIEWEYDVPASATNDSGPNGVTYYEGDLYGETNTAVFALSAETGEKVWEDPNLAEKKGQGFSLQPQPYEGKIFLSTSGQLNGGIAYALDAKSGKVLWEFQETKEKNERQAGGEVGTAGAWNSPAIGPEGEVIYGLANPYRSIETAIKEPTKLLYNDSTVALDQETGKLKWYMQGVPNDFHDWDMQLSPIYVKETASPMVIDSGKMGIVYAMEAKTGKLLWKTPVGKHNGHDNDGLLALEGKLKKPKLPYTYYPGALGGVETNMAVAEGMAFVPINNAPSTFKTYTEPLASLDTNGTGEMVAIDLETGKIVWDDKLATPAYGDATYSDGLVFTTEFGGEVIAFDAKTGKQVWKDKLPAGANSPIAITGEYLIVPAGYPQGAGQKSQIVAYKLGSTGAPAESVLAAGTEAAVENKSGEAPEKEGGAEGGATSALAAGEEVFGTNCSSCHTLAAAGSNGNVGPNLDELGPSKGLVEHQVTVGGGGMPAFGSTLSSEEIKNVAKFVSTWAGKKLTPAQEKLAKENGSAGGP
jgi:glucose dehydrogenase/cytochrome c5